MRRAAKRDANEGEIVTALLLAGWTVVRVSDAGFPDLVAARHGCIVLLEVKGPHGKLTPAQAMTFAGLRAAGVPVHVVRTPAGALDAVSCAMSQVEVDTPKRITLAEGIASEIIPAPRKKAKP